MTGSSSGERRGETGPVKYEEKIGSEPNWEDLEEWMSWARKPDKMSQSEQCEAYQAMWRQYCLEYDDTGIGAANTKEKG